MGTHIRGAQRSLLVFMITVGAVAAADLGADAALERLVFSGNEQVSAKQLRWALAADRQVFMTRHPRAKRLPYMGAVQSRLELGYHASGFPDATVAVLPGEGAFTVTISEGPRFERGAVRVTGPGAAAVDSDAIVAALTQERPPLKPGGDMRDALWEAGTPVNTAAEWQRGIDAEVEQALLRQGWHRVSITSSLERGDGTMALVVQLGEGGEQATIGSVSVHGLEAQPAAVVDDLLAFALEKQANVAVLEAAEKALRETMRFVSVVARYESKGELVTLLVHVQEWPGAPALGQELPQDQAEFLRASQALQQAIIDGTRVLVLEGSGAKEKATAKLVFGSEALELRVDFGNQKAAYRFDGAGLHARLLDGSGFDAFPMGGESGGIQFDLNLSSAVEDDKVVANMGFNMGWSASQDVPVRGRVVLDPVAVCAKAAKAFAREASEERLQIRAPGRDDGEVIMGIDRRAGVLDLLQDPSSGYALHFVPTETALPPLVPAERMVAFSPESASSELILVLAAEGERWMEAIIAAIGDDDSEAQAQAAEALGYYRSRLVPAVVAGVPLAQRLCKRLSFSGTGDEEAVQFHIPPSFIAIDPIGSLIGMVSLPGLALLETMLPPQGWPVTVSRETIWVLNGGAPHAGAELQRLHASPDMGPVGSWVVARLLNQLGHPARVAFAERGLALCTWDGMSVDLAALDGLLAPVANELPSAAELAPILALLEPADAERMRAALDQEQDPMRAALRVWWDIALAEALRADLQSLAGDGGAVVP
ncbi:MAG: hypothetical protein PF961_13415 [Planctomycetota bacterium]|jgi:hypothetical protein|nr:hypothetical protein [Planctomycetota bacterium]